jgi:repressor LexA
MPNDAQDRLHLARLRDHYARFGVLPSYSGICELVGFRSKASSAKLVARLRGLGYLRLAPDGRLAPDERFFERPLVAAVRAGAPDLGQEVAHEVAHEAPHQAPHEAATEALTIDRFLIERPSETVLVRVKGESMRDAGILHGDLVVVERHLEARAGDFVIALVDGALTLKEFNVEDGQVVLKPHNPEFETITASFDLEILGVVTGVVRKVARRRRAA